MQVINTRIARDNRYRDYGGLILMLVLTIIMVHNKYNLDYANYAEAYYKTTNLKGFEFCYFIIQYICKNIGLSFAAFRFFIYVVGMVILWIAIHRIVSKTEIFYFLYFLFPFFLDVIEIRNYIGLTIFVYAFTVLISDESCSKIKYVILMLVASGFHNVYLVFIPFVFFSSEYSSNIKKVVMSVCALLSIILMLFFPTLTLNFINLCYRIIVGGGISGNRDNYLSGIHTHYGYLLILMEQVATFIISYLECRVIESVPNEGLEKQKLIQKKFIKIIFWLNLFAFIFCPIYRIHGQFTRIMQNIMVLTHVAFVATLNVVNNKKSKNIVVIVFLYCLYVLFFFTYIILYSHFNDIFIQTFTNIKMS